MSRFTVGCALTITIGSVYCLDIPPIILISIIYYITFWELESIIKQSRVKDDDAGSTFALAAIITYAFIMGSVFVIEYYKNRQEWICRIIVVSVSDALQYFIGSTYGTTFVSSVSPNKTMEGYLGSLLTIPFFIYWIPGSHLIAWIMLGILGDVYVSSIKRQLKIKDTSTFLGAHGGWLDRVDGIYMSLLI